MSASLVGSEMCIRDSGGTSPVIGRDYRWNSVGTTAQEAAEDCRKPPPACLLYTSDAADDM
eukprot:13956525-Alexandrium_andersonii.AAC.1